VITAFGDCPTRAGTVAISTTNFGILTLVCIRQVEV